MGAGVSQSGRDQGTTCDTSPVCLAEGNYFSSTVLLTCRYLVEQRAGTARGQTPTKAMINTIASTRDRAADIAALRENRAKKTEPAKDTTVETGETPKPSHPAHPHGHVPPGLQRAAENIASKIFARADADASGTVTLQELSAVHSIHARTLASSDLFQTAPAETPVAVVTATTNEIAVDATAVTTDTATDATDVTVETTPETPVQVGITEAQLKEALTKSFYAKVGVTYASPAQPTIEPAEPTEPAELAELAELAEPIEPAEVVEPAPTAPADTTTPSVVDSVPVEPDTTQGFTAVA